MCGSSGGGPPGSEAAGALLSVTQSDAPTTCTRSPTCWPTTPALSSTHLGGVCETSEGRAVLGAAVAAFSPVASSCASATMNVAYPWRIRHPETAMFGFLSLGDVPLCAAPDTATTCAAAKTAAPTTREFMSSL